MPEGVGRRQLAGAIVLALVVATGAAAPIALAGAGTWDGPDLASLDLGAAGAEEAGGRWVAVSLERDGAAVPLDGADPVVLEIDTVVAALVGDTGCSLLLGSFTLTPDGGASFTVPSTRRGSCPPALAARDDAIRVALADATTWHVTADQLTLSGPATRLTLRPAP